MKIMKNFNLENIPDEFRIDIEKAISILKEYNSKEIYIFGSLVHGEFNKESDIDIAITGIPGETFFIVWSKLYMNLNHKVDLINLDKGDRFSKFLLNEGLLAHVA